jgi:hypothetical protein
MGRATRSVVSAAKSVTNKKKSAKAKKKTRGETTVAHGAAFAGDHYCALLPPDVTPNFVGPDRIDPWD